MKQFRGGSSVASIVEYPVHQGIPGGPAFVAKNASTSTIYAGRVVQWADNEAGAVTLCTDADRAIGVAQEQIEPGKYGAIGGAGTYLTAASSIAAQVQGEVCANVGAVDADLTVDANGILVSAAAGQPVVARSVASVDVGSSTRYFIAFNPVYYKA